MKTIIIDGVEYNLTPKVAFCEGDWVVSPNGVYWHIDAIQDGRYQVSSDSGKRTDWPLDTNIYHKFTLQDAKDGDVLCCESGWTCIFKILVNDETFSSYCFMDNTKWFCETGSECHTLKKEFVKAYNGKIYPATKEQRDLLFAKMKEAGYEWDANKKELKEIKQLTTFEEAVKDLMNDYRDAIGDNDATTEEVKKHSEYLLSLIPQNPAWSEEDEDMLYKATAVINRLCAEGKEYVWSIKTLKKIFYWLKSLKYRVQPQQEWSKEDEVKINRIVACLENLNVADNDILLKDVDWLKSLRPQNRWKPSVEQMKQLGWIAKQNKDNMIGKELMSLYQDLKKLKV